MGISRLKMLGDGPAQMVPLSSHQGDAYFGYAPSGTHPDAGLLAVRDKELIWRLFLDPVTALVLMPDGYRVLGVVQPPAPSPPGLVALDSDQRSFLFFSQHSPQPPPPRKLAVASGPVVQAAASHAQPVLGWLTRAGEFVLWDLMEQAVLYRSVPEATP
ncbi:hypothetical protein D7W82_15505 [Corallococcus sp. CA049B]|nr:hypothetical protein D7W82_15505 [Corallococcus sp. CA049B]